MPITISFSDSAINDLQDIKEYYLQEGVPETGENFVHDIFKHVETLYDHPDIGRIVPEFNVQHIREILHPPFRVVYLRENSSINVVRVWRNERLLKLPDENY